MKLALRRKPVTYVRVCTGEGKKAHLATEPVTGVLCGWKPSASGWRLAEPDKPVCHMCEPPKTTQAGA